MINMQSFKLDIKKPTLPRLRVVNGDTANRFVITVQDDGNSVSLDPDLHKVVAVFTRADKQVYTQDADTGLSFTTAGVVTIDVRPASFRTGTNKVCLQIYKREDPSATEYPLLCTTNEVTFTARSQAIPDSGAENAPSQLPMLEQLISDAQEAIDDCEEATEACEEATEAAQTVTETMQGLLENIDSTPTAGSNNLVKSGGVYSMIATETRKNLYLVSVRPFTWSSGSATAETFQKNGALNTLAQSAEFAILASPPDVPPGYSQLAVFHERHRITHDNTLTVYLRTDTIRSVTTYYAATLTIDLRSAYVNTGATVAFSTKNEVGTDDEPTSGSDKTVKSGGVYDAINAVREETPLRLHVTGTEQVVTANHTYRNVIFAAGETDKIYADRNTRDMYFELPAWNADNQTTNVCLRKESATTDASNTTVVEFVCVSPFYSGNDETETVAGIRGYRVAVFFANGVFHSATATYFSKSL